MKEIRNILILRDLSVKKGLAHLDRLNHNERIYNPLLKDKGKWKEITFDEAIDIMVEKLKGYKDNFL